MGRLVRAVPWIGTAVALLTIGSAIRRKGLIGGTVDSALNAIPVVGTLKGLAETARGRDFVRERAPRARVAAAVEGEPAAPATSTR